MNLAPDNLRGIPLYDWHKFLWDRMRAIRKVFAPAASSKAAPCPFFVSFPASSRGPAGH